MSTYDIHKEAMEALANKQKKGKLLVRGEEREWEITKQGKVKYYLEPNTLKDNVLHDRLLFVQEIETYTGAHKHQGGVVIFVLEGRGYTIVDGQRWDWEAGDLVLLPLKPSGVEHQHFNLDPSKPAKWMAFSYAPYRHATVTERTQKSFSPLYKPEGQNEEKMEK